MKVIGDINNEIEKFLQRWNDSTDYIEAYTSGSTGVPQRILLPKIDMLASARTTCDYFNLDYNSLLHLPLSIDYIAGKMMIIRALIADATLCMEIPSMVPFSNVPFHDITLSAVVPSQIRGILDNINKNDHIRLKYLIIGGASLSSELEQELANYSFDSYITYGMTETCSHVALRKVGTPNYLALPGTTFEQDARDCLIINMQKRLVSQVITNDIVELINPTSFQWMGRYDNVINTGGIKVFPEKIEKLLSKYIPRNFIITSRPSIKWGDEVIAIVEGKPIEINYPSNLLSRGEKPKDFIFVDNLPRTYSGKIIRKHT